MGGAGFTQEPSLNQLHSHKTDYQADNQITDGDQRLSGSFIISTAPDTKLEKVDSPPMIPVATIIWMY